MGALGLRLLLRVMAICLSVLWVLTLGACSLSGVCLMSLFGTTLLNMCLLTPVVGLMVLNKVSGASSAGSGVYAHVSGRGWRYRDPLQVK